MSCVWGGAGSVPTPPLDLTTPSTDVRPNSVLLRWSAPEEVNGACVDDYTVYLADAVAVGDAGGAGSGKRPAPTTGAPPRAVPDAELTPGDFHVVRSTTDTWYAAVAVAERKHHVVVVVVVGPQSWCGWRCVLHCHGAAVALAEQGHGGQVDTWHQLLRARHCRKSVRHVSAMHGTAASYRIQGTGRTQPAYRCREKGGAGPCYPVLPILRDGYLHALTAGRCGCACASVGDRASTAGLAMSST